MTLNPEHYLSTRQAFFFLLRQSHPRSPIHMRERVRYQRRTDELLYHFIAPLQVSKPPWIVKLPLASAFVLDDSIKCAHAHVELIDHILTARCHTAALVNM